MSARDAGRFLVTRAFTFGLYGLAVIGVSSWDSDPDSWYSLVRIGGAVMFLWWAIYRTIDHHNEDAFLDHRRSDDDTT